MFFRPKPSTSSSNRRSLYRKGQSRAFSLSVQLRSAAGVTVGEFLDLSVQGAAASFGVDRDPRLEPGEVVELSVISPTHGKVTTPARVVYSQPDGKRALRYGFQFIDTGNLYGQLDAFYARLFNRRESLRVRPSLDRKVKLELIWDGQRMDLPISEIAADSVGLVLDGEQAARLEGVQRVAVAFRLPGVKRPLAGHARIVNRRVSSERVFLALAFDLTEADGLGSRAAELSAFTRERSAAMESWEKSWS